MALTFETVIERLKSLGYPVAQTEFNDTKQKPAPKPPFIIWFNTEQMRGADAWIGNPRIVICEIDASIELYTDIAEAADIDRAQIERRIEGEVLSDVDYKKFQAPIHKENMNQTAYEFKIVQKRRV